MKLQKILRQLREANGYSQKLVAARIGCSPSIVSSYETGERLPSIHNLIALADLYHVSVDTLLGRKAASSQGLDTEGLTDSQINALRVIVLSIQRRPDEYGE